MKNDDGSVPEPIAELIRSIGVRDAALALATARSPLGRPLAMLVLARVVADGADAFWFGSFVEDPSQRAKMSGAAAGWAALEAAAGVLALTRRPIR